MPAMLFSGMKVVLDVTPVSQGKSTEESFLPAHCHELAELAAQLLRSKVIPNVQEVKITAGHQLLLTVLVPQEASLEMVQRRAVNARMWAAGELARIRQSARSVGDFVENIVKRRKWMHVQ